MGKKVIGAAGTYQHTAVWTEAGELFTFGDGGNGRLAMGHGGEHNELAPRLVEALAGKKVIGASAGQHHTAAWTDEGELFTFAYGVNGKLGHAGWQSAQELSPRLVEALAEKNVVGAAVSYIYEHTVAWTGLGSASPLAMETLGSWATEGHRMSLYRGWSGLRLST